MGGKQKLELEVGDDTLHFNVDDADVNQYLNDQMPNEKVKSAYNLLIRTIDDKDKDKFKKIALSGTTPRGIVVMQLATIVAGEFGGELEIAIKKPSNASKQSSKTATSN